MFPRIEGVGFLRLDLLRLLDEVVDRVDRPLVADFCKSNPDKRPVNAIDDFIKKAKKIEAKESDAFDPWEH